MHVTKKRVKKTHGFMTVVATVFSIYTIIAFVLFIVVLFSVVQRFVQLELVLPLTGLVLTITPIVAITVSERLTRSNGIKGRILPVYVPRALLLIGAIAPKFSTFNISAACACFLLFLCALTGHKKISRGIQMLAELVLGVLLYAVIIRMIASL